LGLTNHRLAGRPRPLRSIASRRSHPAFASTSSSLSVPSASRCCARASRRISSRDTESFPCALSHFKTRLAYLCRSLKPTCLRQAIACGQKYSCHKRTAAVITSALTSLGLAARSNICWNRSLVSGVTSGPPSMAQSRYVRVPASRSTWAVPLARHSTSRPSSERLPACRNCRNCSNSARAPSDRQI
jgi:hypothetical protein